MEKDRNDIIKVNNHNLRVLNEREIDPAITLGDNITKTAGVLISL